jgi:hypothetical protein
MGLLWRETRGNVDTIEYFELNEWINAILKKQEIQKLIIDKLI